MDRVGCGQAGWGGGGRQVHTARKGVCMAEKRTRSETRWDRKLGEKLYDMVTSGRMMEQKNSMVDKNKSVLSTRFSIQQEIYHRPKRLGEKT